MDAGASRLCSVSFWNLSTLVKTFFEERKKNSIYYYYSILCANRDEFLSRPTLDADFHSFGVETDQEHQVLSGRDELAGGTWLGINRTGKVAML